MFKRVSQPPVDRALRDQERHSFWPGFVAALVGLVLVVCGARHVTAVDTVDGGMARETQLIKAYSSGGLQYADQLAPPPPPRSGNPDELTRWARQSAGAAPWKVRVDTAAKTPCPT
jgi:hypothetical protein